MKNEKPSDSNFYVFRKVSAYGVFRPPFLPAGFTAEHLLFHLRTLLYLHAAFAASVFIVCCQDVRRSEAVPAAEALDGILWEAKLLPYVRIAAPHAAETDDFFFLFTCHCQHLLTIRRFGGRFEGVLKQKNSPQNKLCSAGCPL